MSVTHTWEIISFERLKTKDSCSNVVQKFFGNLVSVDDVNDVTLKTPFAHNFEDLEPGVEWTVDPDTFTAFESLTQSQVEGWIDTDFANELKASAEASIASSLNTDYANPPWS